MKPIPGLPDYFADENGNIWSDKPGRSGRYKSRHQVKPHVGKGGYLNVVLHGPGGDKRRHTVHRLVCSTYHGEPSDARMVCMHLNGDRTDNRPENLRFGFQSENKAHEEAHGTKLIGSMLSWAKIDEAMALRIKQMIAAGQSAAAVSRDLDVPPQIVYQIRQGKTWVHVPWPDGYIVRKNKRYKLTEAQTNEIRALIANGGLTQKEIGERYGVSDTTIRDIKTGRTRSK